MGWRGSWCGRLAVLAAALAAAVVAPAINAVELSSDDGSRAMDGLDAIPFDQLVNSAVSARVALGFPADPAYVGELVTRQRFGDRSIELVSGLAFTHAEATELEVRDALRAAVGSIGAYGSTQPDSYAGVYLDQVHGTVVARFTRDLDTHLARLEATFVLPERLRVTEARWAVQEMSAASQRVLDDTPALAAVGAQLVGVGASPISNNVLVTLNDVKPAVAAYFSTTFPSGLIDLRTGGPARANASR